MLLGLGVAFWVADSAYLIAVANNTYRPDAWFNGLWYPPRCSPPGPAGRRAARRRGRRARRNQRPRHHHAAGFAPPRWACCVFELPPVGLMAVGLATLAMLVIMARLVMTWRENVGLLHDSRREAITDP